MADFRLRIGFAKTGQAIWLSHLEVVRAMERCVRRSGLPYAVSQGFSPHMKHSFSAALPVGTGSEGEYMDVDLAHLVAPEEALVRLRLVQHGLLPVLGASYAQKDAPSLQVYFNLATYRIELEDADDAAIEEVLRRLQAKPEIEVMKKGKPKLYDLRSYVVSCERAADTLSVAHTSGDALREVLGFDPTHTFYLRLLSRPEGSLRPEVILAALAEPDQVPRITSLTRIELSHQDL